MPRPEGLGTRLQQHVPLSSDCKLMCRSWQLSEIIYGLRTLYKQYHLSLVQLITCLPKEVLLLYFGSSAGYDQLLQCQGVCENDDSPYFPEASSVCLCHCSGSVSPHTDRLPPRGLPASFPGKHHQSCQMGRGSLWCDVGL